MSLELFWIVICCAGVLQSLFLSLYFFLSDRIEKVERFLIGLLFLAISIRLAKSIGWYFFDYENELFLNIGFAAHSFIAPLILVYLIFVLTSKWNWFYQGLLLIPPFVLIISCPFISLENFWYIGGYKALLYATLIYLLWAGYLLNKLKSDSRFRWFANLFVGISIFCLLYFTNYILGINRYITGPIVYSMAVYFISFVVFKNQEKISSGERKKYQNISLSNEQIDEYKKRIEKVMDERLYMDGDFNLTILSEKSGIPKHLLSHFFNEVLSKNFTEYTNSFRIEEAKRRLQDPKFSNLKIASIAYDCGFNSISAFNNAFKKKESISPSEYKNLLNN